MVKRIEFKGQLYALVVPGNFVSEKKYNFLAPEDGFLQFGINYYKSKDKIPNHVHIPCKREITRIEEIILMRRGKMIVTFYNEEKEAIGREQLDQGAILYQMRGGHGFEFLEDAEIFEIKQGPYTSKQDDKMLF